MKIPFRLESIFNSPVTYTGVGYLAMLGAFATQDSVIRGDLVPGGMMSNALAVILVPLTAIGPAAGVGLAVHYFKRGARPTESVLGIVGAAPLLLLWGAVAIRWLRYHVVAV